MSIKMNAQKTVPLLTLGILLAACGAATMPSSAPRASGRLHALEECHGCGITAPTSGAVDHFWAWNEPSKPEAGWNDLDSGQYDAVPFPVNVLLPAPLRGQILDQRSGVILLTLQPSQLQTQDDWLSLACVSTQAQARPDVLSSQDDNWSGHTVQFTPPVSVGSTELTSVDSSTQFCVNTFGPNWQALIQTSDVNIWSGGAAAWNDGSDHIALQ